MKKKLFRTLSVILSVLLLTFCFSTPAAVQATEQEAPILPGEGWNAYKNYLSYLATQMGVFFGGTVQEMFLNKAAFDEYMSDRYAKGYDGTAWNAEEYFTKECIRNPDGTITLSDRMVDDTVAYMKSITDGEGNYFLVRTVGLQNLPPAWFPTRAFYDKFVEYVKENRLVYIDGIQFYTSVSRLDGCNFVFSSSSMSRVETYNNNWQRVSVKNFNFSELGAVTTAYSSTIFDLATFTDSSPWFKGLVTPEGDFIRVYKDVNAMKNYQAGNQPYYAGNRYNSYDAGVDNSITVNGDSLTGNDWSTINNSYYNNTNSTIINNGGDLSASDLAALLDRLLEEIHNSQGGSGDSPGGGSGDTPGGGSGTGDPDGSGSGGGLESLIKGLGKLLDFLLEAIGKFIGLVSEFFSKALGLLNGLSSLTGPFASLLADLMPFVPKELWDVILAGVTLSIVVMVIKIFKG